MCEHFADKLLSAIERKGSPVCVGLDPAYERLPEPYQWPDVTRDQTIESIWGFCCRVLEIVAPIAAAVKPQIAYFEACGPRGIELYFDLVRRAHELGLLVIGDVKRGDIGSTARAYAAAHIEADDAPDAITVNPYFGADGIAPFVEAARDAGKGIFVLVRTSNPSAVSVQDFSDADGRKFYEHVAGHVAGIGAASDLVGERGYSCVGAVVGATYPDEARRLRELMPQQIFLVPGYGAQGASADDCAASFKPDGTGAIVSASRSILYAHERREYAGLDWEQAVEQAVRAFAADIAGAVRH